MSSAPAPTPPTTAGNQVAAGHAVTGSNSTDSFFAQFLAGLGIAVTPGALAALDSVAHYEGQNNYYNPLNVVQKEPGSTQYNSVGVQRYPDFATGVKGSVDLFKNNSVWNGVIAALKTGDANQIDQQFNAVYNRWSPGTHIPILTGATLTSTGARAVGPVGGSGSTTVTPGGAAGGTDSGVNAIDVLPGGAWDPLNWPSELFGAAASSAAGEVANGIEQFILKLVRPVLNFFENAALVFLGIFLIVLGIIFLALGGSDSSGQSNAPPPGSSSPTSGSKGERGEVAESGGAEDAAVLA